VDAICLKSYAIYIFDYGAPTGLRLALKRPEAVTAIITQNGNAYEEGLGADFWKPLRSYWMTDSPDERKAIGDMVLTFGITKWQYENGSPYPIAIQPEAYHLDQALLERPGNRDIQLDLFRDYGNNLSLYPKFHQYFRDSGVPLLAIWGKNDVIFTSTGAEAFARDVKKFELHLIDAGHFALENNEDEFAEKIGAFLKKHAPV
jgi:pimeloyl-ACP methyl ester carboxylesterase